MCTGNIHADTRQFQKKPVYPCVYREHVIEASNKHLFTGLSLCVQGTFIIIMIHVYLLRFIPVCTGNIKFFWICSVLISVYPCVYREHRINRLRLLQQFGLSLCVQGTYNLH